MGFKALIPCLNNSMRPIVELGGTSTHLEVLTDRENYIFLWSIIRGDGIADLRDQLRERTVNI